MNKKDINQLAKAGEKSGGEEAYRAAWFRMYAAVIGGQVGWLTGAISDPARFKTRLRTLADIATSALDLAVLDGRIKLKVPQKTSGNGASRA